MQKLRALARSVVATLALAAMLASPAQAAGGKGSTFENALLQLIFNATAISQLALNASSSPATNLCVALHTSSPAAGGTQSTNEAAYTSYARVLVARSSSGWTVSSNSVSPASTIVFPAATGGSETETYFSIGLPTTGGDLHRRAGNPLLRPDQPDHLGIDRHHARARRQHGRVETEQNCMRHGSNGLL